VRFSGVIYQNLIWLDSPGLRCRCHIGDDSAWSNRWTFAVH